jgi:hypothetical protein
MVILWYYNGIISEGRTRKERRENGERMGVYSSSDLIRDKFVVLIRLKYL